MTRSGSAVWVVVDAREVSDGLAAAMGTNQLLTSAAVRTCPTDQVGIRSEEHTSELQSLRHLVCRLLLEKKNRCLTALARRESLGAYRHRDDGLYTAADFAAGELWAPSPGKFGERGARPRPVTRSTSSA